MPLTLPDPEPAKYGPPARLVWFADDLLFTNIELSQGLADALSDEEVASISAVIDGALKRTYPNLRITRWLEWQHTAPNTHNLTVVQEWSGGNG